jgi:hypothetical protein
MADQGQPARPALAHRVGDAGFQVVQQRVAAARPVRVADLRVKDGRIAGLTDVGAGAEDQPQGSSLNPPPISALPFFVSGWYW